MALSATLDAPMPCPAAACASSMSACSSRSSAMCMSHSRRLQGDGHSLSTRFQQKMCYGCKAIYGSVPSCAFRSLL